jgi:hypothetical protein
MPAATPLPAPVDQVLRTELSTISADSEAERIGASLLTRFSHAQQHIVDALSEASGVLTRRSQVPAIVRSSQEEESDTTLAPVAASELTLASPPADEHPHTAALAKSTEGCGRSPQDQSVLETRLEARLTNGPLQKCLSQPETAKAVTVRETVTVRKPPRTASQLRERLIELRQMKHEGLLSDEEFNVKRAQALASNAGANTGDMSSDGATHTVAAKNGRRSHLGEHAGGADEDSRAAPPSARTRCQLSTRVSTNQAFQQGYANSSHMATVDEITSPRSRMRMRSASEDSDCSDHGTLTI